ncbi:MAG TPA: transglycosylase SLT domain-containing protein [Polyangia bacterium]
MVPAAVVASGVPSTQPAVARTHPAGPASRPAEPLEVRAYRATQQDALDALILAAALDWRLDPFLLKGLLYVESRLDPTRVNSRTGATGIAQMTAGGRRGVTNIRRARGVKETFTRAHALDARAAIPAAAELLAHLGDQYGRDGALAGYNAGPWAGRLVQRAGYWHAKPRVGAFVLLVLREANRLRREAGLPPLPSPPRRRAPAALPNT